jgi:hypothetical protein
VRGRVDAARHANRPFWTAAAAFFDALAFGGLDVSRRPSRSSQVDQQVKQLIDGAAKVPSAYSATCCSRGARARASPSA